MQREARRGMHKHAPVLALAIAAALLAGAGAAAALAAPPAGFDCAPGSLNGPGEKRPGLTY